MITASCAAASRLGCSRSRRLRDTIFASTVAAVGLILSPGLSPATASSIAPRPAHAATAAKLRVTVTPATVAPGGAVSVKITGTRSRSCRISVRMDKRGALAKVRRRVPSRQMSLTIGATASPGRRIVAARCGSRRASTRLTVTATPSAPAVPGASTEAEETYGDLPVDGDLIDTLQAGVGVGGAGFSTMVPLAKGSRVRLSQGPGGGFSHFKAFTRNAVDLALGAGTPVLSGFSGVVVGAKGGCLPAKGASMGCNFGWGNFVLLKHADGTCSISAHLTLITVAVGQQIGRAAQIGTVGSSGSSTGDHLHYDRVDCRTQTSLPWRFEEPGPMVADAWFTSANEPSPAVAPPAPAPAPAPPAAPPTVRETSGPTPNKTFTNHLNAGAPFGPTIPANTTLQITCKAQGFVVSNGNPWWYKIASAPWNNQFWATADAFYNNGATSGSLAGTPFVDNAVPNC